MDDFYVYLIRRPDGRPCYVGKGRGRRHKRHEKKSTNPHLANIYKNSGGKLPCEKVGDNLTEAQAFDLEIKTIREIGREPIGPLVNMTDGGEGVSGLRFSEESKRRMSDSRKGQIPWNVGMKMPDEVGMKISKSKTGKKQTESHRAAISAGNKDKVRTQETCARISSGKTGKKASDATKAALRDGNRSRDPEVRARIGPAVRMALHSQKHAGNMQWL